MHNRVRSRGFAQAQLPWVRVMVAAFLLAASAVDQAGALRSSIARLQNQYTPAPNQDALDARLGVRRIQLYVQVPVVKNGTETGSTTTAVATLWLRRVGGGQAGPYALPHQAEDAIRGFLWLDDPNDLKLRGPCSHLLMPTTLAVWKPSLRLETAAGGVLLRAHVDTDHTAVLALTDPIRPYSFRFTLPPGAGTCFKILEESYPHHKVGFCLNHNPRLCAQLAPPEAHTAATPALWAVVGPVRDATSSHGIEWVKQARRTAFLVHHFLSYHLAAGVSGLMLYADGWSRSMLQKQPLLVPYLRNRTLRLIKWEMMERWDTEGHPAYNGYNYDQALHSSHALLGASACGANLQLLLTDLDEYLYLPRGRPWPEPHDACLAPGAGAGAGAGEQQQGAGGGGVTAMAVLLRRNIHASSVEPKDEAALWTGGQARSTGLGLAGGGGAGLRNHPLALYDKVAREPLPWVHSKRIMTPAAEIIAFFVHEGFALHGETRDVDLSCVSILHVQHMLRMREGADRDAVEPLTHWLLPGPGHGPAPEAHVAEAAQAQGQQQLAEVLQHFQQRLQRLLSSLEGHQRIL